MSSTYLGGTGSDAANAVAVDSLANEYLAGQTASSDFRLQTAFQTFNAGPYGGFCGQAFSRSDGRCVTAMALGIRTAIAMADSTAHDVSQSR